MRTRNPDLVPAFPTGVSQSLAHPFKTLGLRSPPHAVIGAVAHHPLPLLVQKWFIAMDPCPPGEGLNSNSFVAGCGHVTGACWPLEAGQGTGLHPSLDHAGRDECAAERSALPALGHRHRRNGLTFKPLQRWSPRLGQPRETGWVPPSPTVPAVRESKLWFSQKEVSTPRINSGDSCAASFPSSVGESLGRAGEAVQCWGPVLRLLSALELAGRRPPPPLGVFRARLWTCGGHGGAAEPGPDPGLCLS